MVEHQLRRDLEPLAGLFAHDVRAAGVRPRLRLGPPRHQRHERRQQRTQASHVPSIARGAVWRLFASRTAAEVEAPFRTPVARRSPAGRLIVHKRRIRAFRAFGTPVAIVP